LKPGFFTNEHLAELGPWHRLCFAGLWTLADREGRLEDRPRRIKAALFPYDDVDMESLLSGLAGKDFIVRYTADGAAYIAIQTFTQHQRPKTDEFPSSIPAPLFEHPRGISPDRAHIKDIGTEDRGQGTEGSGADGAPLEAAAVAGAQRRAEDFSDLWNTRTSAPIPRCRDLTSKRRRHIKARLTERSWDEWIAVLDRIEQSSFCRGQNDRGWLATFDWVIGSPDVAVKVLEGKYDNRGARGVVPSSPISPQGQETIKSMQRVAERIRGTA
jgi:hypothetical protein